TISAATHHMNVDYSCYEGLEVQGAADLVMSRGTVLVRDGAWVGPGGHGRFLRRSPAVFARGA
ncbi:MAG: dihydropyrimidinase, partial [Chloroflexi bacterium]|nr:dihydropyrimidinase [Chloroflexota bacterium]